MIHLIISTTLILTICLLVIFYKMSIGLSHIHNSTLALYSIYSFTCLLHVVPVTDRHLCSVIHTFTMPEFQMSTRNYEYVLRA